MREVAALAGVSIKTVSRVINAEPAVSADLTTRVAAAIDRLDYRHNMTASSLRRSDGRTATIGVVLEDVANPFSSALHRAIEDVAVERGVLVLAGSSDEDANRERRLVSAFASRRVDGLVIQPATHDHSFLITERKAGTAIVFVDRPPAFLDADTVVTDNAVGVRRGVRHLVDHGHHHIGYLGDLHTIATAAERYQGYVAELAAQRIELDERRVRLDIHGIDNAAAAVTELLIGANPPTALFTAQNLITIGAFRALRKLGLHQKIALIGFDDILLADLLEPAITVIAQDPAAIGRAAAEMLFRRLDGDRSPAQHQVVPTRLIARGSGEIRP
ncbi:MAG TPA: LacI family DNA-binding transcriptional regulator [Candidatus Dormibacteraeota bacterium]|nr:LacI family DNA-binding transcriptional regulator [Candidatus Dormibacteraeota bacterium]HVS49137.1 LacI family DNA-binding transcriptional regulator [Candidatus Dormibacteraeota bacterium]